MNNAGAQEFLASAVLPARSFGKNQEDGMFTEKKCLDLKIEIIGTSVLGQLMKKYSLTLQEVKLNHISNLPINLYQIQTKYRDERETKIWCYEI